MGTNQGRRGAGNRRWACAVLLAGGFTLGCGMQKEIAAATRLQAELKKKYGVDSRVIVNTHNGKKTVTVRLERIPAGEVAAVKAGIEALVRVEFPPPTTISIEARL